MGEVWPYVTIREIGGVGCVQTGPFGAQLHADDYVEDGVPLILIRNIQDGGLDLNGLPRISEADATRLGMYSLVEGDVVFSRVGRVGSCFLVEACHSGWIISGQLLRVRLPPNAIDRRFLLHALHGHHVQAAIADAAVGTTRTSINTSILEQLPIPLPPPHEQRRIAEILDTIDDGVRAAERIATKLGITGTGAVRHELMTLRDQPMVSLHERVADVTVGIVVRPTQFYTESGIPVLRSANVRESGITMTDLVFMSPQDHARLNKTAVRPGDVLTVRTGYPETTAVVPPSLLSANCVDVVITRTDGRIDPEFLALWVNSDFGKGHVLARQGGLAQQHFNVGDMKMLPIPDVSLDRQRQVLALNEVFEARLIRERRSVKKLRHVRAGLAEDLLSGRVRAVPE